MAVAMAILMATAMRRGTAPLMKGREGTFMGSALNSTVSFVAVAFTSAINAGVMRKGELVSGIQVQEPDGENKEVGLSQVAAKSAL
jgi:Kef-type K+ transport system membrane component KefB